MTEAQRLLADLRSRGIELETDGVRLRWKPAVAVSAPLAASLLAERDELVKLLAGPDVLERCPTCRWHLDSARRCVKCFDRLCVDCGRLTGSYFLMRCVICSATFRG